MAGRRENLQRHGASELSVMCGFGGEEVVPADVHHEERVVGDKAEAVGSGCEAMTADFDGGLREEVSLILLLNGTGITGGIDEGGQKESICREAHATGVTSLDGGALS